MSREIGFQKKITRSVMLRCIIEILLYTVVLAGFIYLSIMIITMRTWYGYELLYKILSLAYNYKEILVLGVWILGIGVIIIRHFRQLADYVEQLADASKQLVQLDDSLIQLPVELASIEHYMNDVKRTAYRNANAAKEAEQRKNDLVVYLAHDLKTPLTSVIGYLSLLREEKEISEELRQKYLNVAFDRAERLEELINEFFEITRFNLTHQPLEYSRVNFSRMMEQIVYEFIVLFEKKNLTYRLEMDQEIQIRCDVKKIERVMDNLLRNAINYSFPNSCIEIIVKEEHGQVAIKVKNHGNTIPEEKLQRIFEQFFRLDSSRTSSTGGSGLGLAIAKQIVEQHQGRILADSHDELIEFTVILPTTYPSVSNS